MTHHPAHRLSPQPAAFRLAGLLALVFFAVSRLAALPAFPGAEGFGTNASGGRGGSVYRVTNLNDSGAGSFRDAVSVAGRTVVFDVGGIIVVSSPVVVKGNMTIAGQTAPGEGVTIYGDRLSFSDANNTIVRYMRFREGINGDSGTDAVGAASGNLMMFDHISASWGRDETFSLSGTPSNVTLQDCIIGQGLLIHSAGSLMQTDGGVSIFRCLYTDNYMRNPKIKGVNDYQNNVVYNWGSGGGYIPAGDSAGFSYANMIGCYFIAGPTTGSEGPFKTGNNKYSLFHSGNFQDLNLNGALDGSPVTDASFPTLTVVGTQFNYPKPATLLTAQQALAHILTHVGASLFRDHADTYMLGELASYGTIGAHISNESEIGGVGTVAGGVAAKDTDGDGVPDWWEEAAGTNPLVADHNVVNADGYTNLEHYINGIARAGVPAATIDGLASDTGSSSADGITSVGTLVFHGTAAPGLTVTLARIDTGVIGTAVADSLGQWTFDYSGTPLADRYYAFFATVALPGGLTSPPTRAFVVKVDTAAAAAPVITSIVTSPSFAINGTSEVGSIVNVTLSGTGVVATTTTDALGNWTASYPGGASLPPGVYTFTAAAIDLAGNPGPASAAYVINTGIAAPVFASITTDSGASASDQITNDTTLTFNGTSAASATITLTRLGVGVIGTTNATIGGTWSFVYGTTLTSGVFTFNATASVGGNASPASPNFPVTVDTTKPTVSSIRRLNPTTAATLASTLVYRVTFSEPVSGVDLADFSLTLGSGVSAALSSLAPVSSTVYDITVINAAGDSTVRLDLKASGTGIVDVAGNAIAAGFTTGQTYTLRLPGSSVWISDDDAQLWSNAANWENGAVASGSGATADFTGRNLSTDITVRLDTPRTLGRVTFGDVDFETPASWTLSDNGSAANVLTLAGATPNLHVDGATTPTGDTADVPAANAYPANLAVVLAGTSGFTKTGVGTLQILKPATITGPLTITKGIVQVGVGGSYAPSAVTIATSQQLRIDGGTFNTAGNVTWTSGTGTGIIVSAGTASFQKIIPSNTRNSFVKVTGGTFTATDISFPRSGDSESQAIASGILISGGDSTVGTIGLGTVDSWGAMTITGGRMTVTGPLNVGFQKTSTRGGVVSISAGELNVTDTAAGGMIMSHNPGGSNANTNNVSKFVITGGVSNVALLTLGFDSTSSAGSAAVTLNGGELNLGTGGIVKNGTSGLASSVTLTTGTIGAFGSWSTTHPLVLAGTPATASIRAASTTGVANDLTFVPSSPVVAGLTGALTGTGGFAKTGAGTLTLGAVNTFTGDVAVTAGTLAVNGSVAAGGAFAVGSGGTLAGTGTVNRAVLLDTGGTVSPGAAATATLTATSLTWNGGATFAADLGATGVSDKLILTGALTKGTAGTATLAFTARSGFAAGNTYTLATFASTGFVAADFTVTGLPAGYAGTVTVTATSLQLTIVGTPAITSPATAGGTYHAPFAYTITATNGPVTFSALGLPDGLVVDPVTGAISGAPNASGTFAVTLRATNLAGTGTAPLALTIDQAVAAVAVGNPSGNQTKAYDGTPRAASATTTPSGLGLSFTYNGSATAPTLPGTYAVVGTVSDPNYTGTNTGTLVIAATATLRHAPVITAALDGSVQVVTAENVALAGNAWVSGDLLVPGTPTVVLAGTPTYASTLDATGAATPADFTVAIAGNAVLRHVVRRVDASALPTVAAPPAPLGTRNIILNTPGQSAGDFATVRNLTLAGSAGIVAVPAGTYGAFTLTGNSTLVLGVAGATEPAVYNLQSLAVNLLPGQARIQVVGPVVITVASGANFNGMVGEAAHPEWLTVRVANNGFTATGNVVTHGNIIAPTSTVTLNSAAVLNGTVVADRLVLNATSLLNDPNL